MLQRKREENVCPRAPKRIWGTLARPPLVALWLTYFFFFAAFFAFFLVAMFSILPLSQRIVAFLECIESLKNDVKGKVRVRLPSECALLTV
jgi:hypothetical protein